MDRYVLGTAGIGGVWGPVEPEESVQTVLRALELGFTAIDTAPAYAEAEAFVGKALRQWKGPMPFVSTKVGRLKTYSAHDGRYDYSAAAMERSVLESMEVLGVPKLDLLFLHDPGAIPEDKVGQIIEQLQQYKVKGYAKQVGLGGNPPACFAPFINKNNFDVVMEYSRFTAICYDAMTDSIPNYLSQGIQPYMASPLHMGLLGRQFEAFSANPPGWVDPSAIRRAAVVNTIAQRQGLSLPALAHRYVFSFEANIKLVLGASNLHELEDTWRDILSGPLPGNVVEEIRSLSDPKEKPF